MQANKRNIEAKTLSAIKRTKQKALLFNNKSRNTIEVDPILNHQTPVKTKPLTPNQESLITPRRRSGSADFTDDSFTPIRESEQDKSEY